jgi:hypothetical protein
VIAPNLTVELTAQPLEFALAAADRFEIGVRATNIGTMTVDPGLDRVRLLVNGGDSLPFSETVSNGMVEAGWYALPPGETVSTTWQMMGPILFSAPGDYRLELVLGADRSAPQVVRVLG